MKKFVSILLVVMTLLTLVACEKDENPATTGATVTTAPATKEPQNLTLSDVYATMVNGVQMPEMLEIDSDMLLDLYGIKAEHYKQAQVYMCSNSLQADEIWLIEATDSAALATLKGLAEARLQQKDDESVTYSPEQNAIVKKAHLATYGNYLVMIVSPEVETLTAAFKTAAGI